MRALGLLALATVVSGCIVGRDLTYVDESQRSSASKTLPEGDEVDAGTDATPAPSQKAHDAAPPKTDAGTAPASGECEPEAEPNDQSIQGNKLSTGTTCGDLVVGSDVDWFQFDVDAPATVSLAFQADDDAYIAIVGIAKSDTYSGKAGSKIQFEAQGKYYVRIYSFNTHAQKYEIRRD